MTKSNARDQQEQDEPDPQEIAAQHQWCRKALAIWLHMMADRVGDGTIDSFDIKWSHQLGMPRPIGGVLMDPQFMNAPSPEQLEASRSREATARSDARPERSNVTRVNPPRAPGQAVIPRAPIIVEDQIKNLRDVKQCDDDECDACKRKA